MLMFVPLRDFSLFGRNRCYSLAVNAESILNTPPPDPLVFDYDPDLSRSDNEAKVDKFIAFAGKVDESEPK